MSNQSVTDDVILEGFRSLHQAMADGFERVNERFAEMDRRFADFEHRMMRRFDAVDERFAEMDRRFDRIEAVVAGHERRITALEAKP